MQILKSGVTLASKIRTYDRILKQLPPTLYNKTHIAATDYSKVSRGLHFPLEISGIRTRQSVQRILVGDSEDLVTPFMQVVIQTTRYYAHCCYFPSIEVLTINDGGCTFLHISSSRLEGRTISSPLQVSGI